MATDNVVPNGDVTTEWQNPASPHYDDIDEGPNYDSAVIGTYEGDANDIEIFNMTTITPINKVLRVDIRIRGKENGTPGKLKVDIKLGTWLGAKEVNLPTGSMNWATVTWDNLDNSQLNLNNMRVKLIANSGVDKNNGYNVDKNKRNWILINNVILISITSTIMFSNRVFVI